MGNQFSVFINLENASALHSRLPWSRLLRCAGLALSIYFMYCFTIKPFMSPLRKIPGPGYNPLFGNVREAMVGQAMETSVKWVKKYGGIVRFYHLLGRERLLVADPAALKHIFITNESNYERPGSSNIVRLIGKSVLLATGSPHKAQRRLLNPLFNHEAIARYLATFEKCAWEMIDLWKANLMSPIPVQADLQRLSLDTFGEAVLGETFGCLMDPDSKMAAAFQGVTSVPAVSLANVLPLAQYIPTATNRKHWQMVKMVDNLVYGIIARKRQNLRERTEEDVRSKSCHLVDQLLLARDVDSGQGMSDEEVHDQLLALIIAGNETTSATMSWLLLTLAEHPIIQDKVRTEVQEVLPPKGKSVTWEHLEKLKYLDCVIKEGQRLYPAAPSFFRRARQDDHLGGHFVPAGTVVVIHIGAMMRNPEIWQEPEEFCPERFQGDNTPGLFSHLPFGAGPNKCLGHQFARLQMRLVLALLLREFQFCTVPGYKVQRKLRTTLQPVPPVKLSVSMAT